MGKGICKKQRIVYGVVTISDKGQIAIPVDLRKALNIDRGSKFIVLKRKDDAGFTLLKLSKMDDLMHKIQEDETIFQKSKGGD